MRARVPLPSGMPRMCGLLLVHPVGLAHQHARQPVGTDDVDLAALHGQDDVGGALTAHELDTVSRAYFTDRLGTFLARACELTGIDAAPPERRHGWSSTAIRRRAMAYNVILCRASAPRSSLRKATSMAAPPPSSASRRSLSIATSLVRLRRASGTFRSATSMRTRPPSARQRRHPGQVDPVVKAASACRPGINWPSLELCLARNVLLVMLSSANRLGRPACCLQHGSRPPAP